MIESFPRLERPFKPKRTSFASTVHFMLLPCGWVFPRKSCRIIHSCTSDLSLLNAFRAHLWDCHLWFPRFLLSSLKNSFSCLEALGQIWKAFSHKGQRISDLSLWKSFVEPLGPADKIKKRTENFKERRREQRNRNMGELALLCPLSYASVNLIKNYPQGHINSHICPIFSFSLANTFAKA